MLVILFSIPDGLERIYELYSDITNVISDINNIFVFLDTTLYGQDHELNDDKAYYMFRELKTFSIVQLVNIM
ncbi:unnamed protein product [Rotaria sordida]|uniref:Uncharacterized protein n=1 Tax=Rotaria sordida TaxID=392033 RepID=A0A815PN80_9BILA|nr:unnamed protein product [Rotaria sordida]CAF1376390.1 unnamed protein product [Rotaria sordida]CAF1451737.1 unnamed protein product [Rotaria sordida]CAF3906039.1 unnamed protein product [Rotaria sordida]CAF3906056.1 unnamed protein product [Rotaria sordida]